MSFFNKLLKGFIRSTVNQVGRDSEKVISNKIYKGRHSSSVNLENNHVPNTRDHYLKNNDETVRP